MIYGTGRRVGRPTPLRSVPSHPLRSLTYYISHGSTKLDKLRCENDQQINVSAKRTHNANYDRGMVVIRLNYKYKVGYILIALVERISSFFISPIYFKLRPPPRCSEGAWQSELGKAAGAGGMALWNNSATLCSRPVTLIQKSLSSETTRVSGNADRSVHVASRMLLDFCFMSTPSEKKKSKL